MSEQSQGNWAAGIGGAFQGGQAGAQMSGGNPYAAAAGAIIGGGLSLMGRKKAGKAAETEQQKMERLENERMERLRDLAAQEEARIAPIRQSLYDDASSDQPLDYQSTQADLRRRYQDAVKGIRSGRTDSGLASSQEQAANLDLASQLSGAYDQGLKNRRQLRMGLYSQSPINQLNYQAATSGDRLSQMYNQREIEAMKAKAAANQGFLGGLGNLGNIMGGMKFGGGGGGDTSTSTSYSSPNLQGLGGLGQMGGGEMPGGSPNFGGGGGSPWGGIG